MTTLIFLACKVIRIKFLFMVLPISVLALQGCTVLAVAGAVGAVAVGTANMVTDAAIGTARLGGKAIGAAAGSPISCNSDEKK